jgi:hypothetical protein
VESPNVVRTREIDKSFEQVTIIDQSEFATSNNLWSVIVTSHYLLPSAHCPLLTVHRLLLPVAHIEFTRPFIGGQLKGDKGAGRFTLCIQ